MNIKVLYVLFLDYSTSESRNWILYQLLANRQTFRHLILI